MNTDRALINNIAATIHAVWAVGGWFEDDIFGDRWTAVFPKAYEAELGALCRELGPAISDAIQADALKPQSKSGNKPFAELNEAYRRCGVMALALKAGQEAKNEIGQNRASV